MNSHFKQRIQSKKIALFLLCLYIIQVTYGLNPVHAKKYATLSFLKNRMLHILLFQGAEQGDPFIIIDAVKRNALLNIQNEKGQTPLMVAVIHSHQAAVEALVFAGASVSIKDANGKTALDYALHSSNKNIAALLLQNAKNS